MKMCCGLCSLQTGVKLIAILSFVLALNELRTAINIMKQDKLSEDDLTFSMIMTIMVLADLILNVVLLYGAWKRRLTPVKVWLWVNVVLAIIIGIGAIAEFVVGESWIKTAYDGVLVLFFLYFVNEFRKELIAEDANSDLSVTRVGEISGVEYLDNNIQTTYFKN